MSDHDRFDPAVGPTADGRADSTASPTAGRIERLAAETVERIAAGEVVTRPARAVGELLDNALDAGAASVRVRVVGDGTERIAVADDGHGMARTDAVRAVEAHTTSKLADADELETVQTLGFRGEGLAAIADAARELELVTNDTPSGDAADDPSDDDPVVSNETDRSSTDTTAGVGTRVTVQGDGSVSVEPAGRDHGTTVTVRGLFADRPARRESLAQPASEFGRISRLVARYALLYPEVAFRLVHDGNETLATPGTGRTDATLAVYDRETARASESFSAERSLPSGETIQLSGLLVHPTETRATREHVHCSVNGRPIANDRLQQAVAAGYDRLLAGDEEPIAVCDVRVPPASVDPNVHPAKRRVALANAEDVAHAVERVVRDRLRTADLAATEAVTTEVAAVEPTAERDARLAEAVYLGQYRELYLLCEADGDLLVVDQHAAHERVTFERLRAALADETVPSRAIDPPATVSLDPATAATVAETADDLRRLGFSFESFGGRSYRVSAVPAPLGRVAAPESLGETAAVLADEDSDPREDLLAEFACHPSLRAGDTLGGEEARQLLDRLAACDQPYACPHGRPTVLRIEEATLARGFERANTRLE